MTNTPTAKREQMDAWLARLDPDIKARFDANFDALEAAKKMVSPAQQAALDATEDSLLISAKLMADSNSQAGATAARSTPASDAKPTISISPDKATIDPQIGQRFTATADYPNGTKRMLTDAVWRSSDPLVTVNAKGLVLAMHAADAKKPISATITATDPVSGAQGTAHILVEKSQPVTMSKEQEYEANAAYYESTRQSQLEAAAKVHASFREGIPKMSRTEIDSQWDAEKEDFIAVAASPTHGLKREQLLQIWLRYWSDRYKASQVERAQIADLKPNERSAALKRQDTDEKLANFMIRSAPLVNEYLIAAEVEGKHVTLDELNKAAAKLEGFHEAWVSALGMVVASGEGTGGGPRQEVVPPVKAKEPSTGAGGGGTEPPTGGRGGGPSRPPSQTIKASPPPPPQQASRPGAPTPVTDVEVMKTNVGSPASIRTQSPGPHQTDWTARGGTGKAPAAYRDSDGIVHVSTDHPLMGSPNRGGIPPVRPGDTTQPGPTPPHTQPAPSSTLSDKAPTPAKPPVDPGARTQAAPAKAAPVPKNAPTGGAAAESKREQAPRGHIDPPQEVSRQVVENIRNRPRTVDPRRKGSGSNVSYTTDHEAHELAWKRLGGHGDSPPAFIYDNQVYLDPSRWKD